MEKEWTYDGTKKKKAWSIGVVSGISKLRRYLTGGMIGMCFQYVYKRMLCFFGIHDWKYFSNGSDNGKFCKRCKKYRLDNGPLKNRFNVL